jgi:hypothetical protein
MVVVFVVEMMTTATMRGCFSRAVPAAGLLLRGVLQPVRRGVTVRSSTTAAIMPHARGYRSWSTTRVSHSFRGGRDGQSHDRWPGNPPPRPSHRRAAQAHLRGRGVHPSDPQVGGSAPPKPRCMKKLRTSSTRTRTRRRRITRCGKMNNVARHQLGWASVAVAGLLRALIMGGDGHGWA